MQTFNACSLLIVLFLFSVKHLDAFSVELSVLVEPNNRECFHQYLQKDLTIEIDFQVLTGGDGLDISFWASSPTNVVVTHLQRQQNGRPVFTTRETGEYRFCFDNSFSRFSSKQVHFYIGSTEEYADPIFQPKPIFEPQSKLSVDELGELDDKLDNFRHSFKRVVQNLAYAQRLQHLFRQYESIDRSLMELSFDRVNLYSTMNVIVLLIVAFIQVYMIRSLFEDKSKVGRMLRGDKPMSRSFT